MEPADNLSSPNSLDHANRLLAERRIREALRAYDVAEQGGYPRHECAAGRWMCWMLIGDFESAWRQSDKIERYQITDPNRFWDGQPFNGKRVLLRALHGFGDTVQFIRYAPLLRRVARRLIVQSHTELMPLLQKVEGVDETITWPDPPSPHSRWDQQVEIMELPRAFRTKISSIPNQMPYISVESSMAERSRKRLVGSTKPRIGLIWASSQYDTTRSLKLEKLSPILRMDAFEFYSFQRGSERMQLKGLNSPVHDIAIHSPTIIDTAADLTNMALVISVDTFAAHLAAALKRPVWLLLPFAADWRWLLSRRDSPWYPTMRLFRQSAPGEWEPVISEVVDELTRVRLAG